MNLSDTLLSQSIINQLVPTTQSLIAGDICTVFTFSLLFITYLIFPFFLYVQRQNHEADKLTLVYPIIKHFNFVVKFMISHFALFMVYLPVWSNVISIFNFIKSFKLLSVIAIILGSTFLLFLFLSILFMSFTPNVQYILHFLMALQRFLIYFNPETEKFIILSEKKFRILLIFLYLISLFLTLYNVFKVFLFANEKMIMKFDFFIELTTSFYVLNALQIIGALLYIPIMTNLSKLTHLQSAVMHKPHKYVFYQIMVHLVSRIVFVPIILSGYSSGYNNYYTACLIVVTDIFMTPLTIQLAYLLCNRKNVQTLLSNSVMEIFKRLIFPNYQATTVHPESVLRSTSAVRPEA